jgi:prepilin-type N-terminal cleavage/methylation domain-containing protein
MLSHSRGFTLIELIVSLTIMAMISGVVLSAMRTGLLVWNKGTDHVEDLRRSRAVHQILNDSISGALPLMFGIRSGEGPVTRRLAFDGSTDHLRFVSRTSFKDGPNAIPRWIDLRWVRDSVNPSGALVAEERLIRPPDNLPDTSIYWTGSVLQADGCDFAFLDGAIVDRPATWLPEWRPLAEHLPKAIRIRCTMQSKEVVSVSPLDYAVSYAEGLRLN